MLKRVVAAAGLVALLSSTALAAMSAQEFVQKAAVGGMFEVKSSEAALAAGAAEPVAGFATMMVSDHGKANEELKTIAGQKSIPVPADLDEKHAAMLAEITGATGDAMVSAYGKNQLAAHQEAVTLFQTYSTEGEDADLKAFATRTLPTLQGHLDMAKTLPGAGM